MRGSTLLLQLHLLEHELHTHVERGYALHSLAQLTNLIQKRLHNCSLGRCAALTLLGDAWAWPPKPLKSATETRAKTRDRVTCLSITSRATFIFISSFCGRIIAWLRGQIGQASGNGRGHHRASQAESGAVTLNVDHHVSASTSRRLTGGVKAE